MSLAGPQPARMDYHPFVGINDRCEAELCGAWRCHDIHNKQKEVEMDGEEEFDEAMLAMIDGAKNYRKMYVSFLEAGFSEDQALKLLAWMLVAQNAMSELSQEQKGR